MNRPSLFLKLIGYTEVECGAEYAAPLLNLLGDYGIVYSSPTLRSSVCSEDGEAEEGRFRLFLPRKDRSRLLFLASARGIALSFEKNGGLPTVLYTLLCRPGMMLGILFSLLLLFFGQSVLWEIRITGNETLSGHEIIEELSEVGLAIGAPIRGIDVDHAENRLLLSSNRISWVSVNLLGTVLEVQIREKESPRPAEELESGGPPANLIARCDGILLECEVLEGLLVKTPGTAVRKGELLVSGLYDSNVLGLRYTRARGRLYAEVEHTLSVEIPFSYERERVVGKSRGKLSLVFFGKTLPLFEKEMAEGERSYLDVTSLSLYGKRFPIAITVETRLETETVTSIRSEESAMELAYQRLEAQISALPGLREVLEKHITYEITEDAYLLSCRIVCVENIAESREIEIGLFEETKEK